MVGLARKAFMAIVYLCVPTGEPPDCIRIGRNRPFPAAKWASNAPLAATTAATHTARIGTLQGVVVVQGGPDPFTIIETEAPFLKVLLQTPRDNARQIFRQICAEA